MEDRELLELAARSVGLWDSENNCIDIPWSPLTDDGAALRLAVKLRLEIAIEPGFTAVITEDAEDFHEHHSADPYAATRRAIVRAAAEIARQQGKAEKA